MNFDPNDQERLLTLWTQYVLPTLGPKAFQQFKRATLKPSNWFVENIIAPTLYREDALGGVYYPVDITTLSKGRNHNLAKAISDSDDTLRIFGDDVYRGLTYFANAL